MILAPTAIEIAETHASETPARSSIASYAKAVITELRRAVAANAAHDDLARRSDAALKDMGLSRTGLARHIHDTHYID
jgi:hypothetical protein